MATITNGITTSFANTPQAGNDLFANTAFTEDSLGIAYLDVMANDLGGAAKTLWSLDDGSSVPAASKIYAPKDLLTQDMARAEAASTDVSTHGAKIWITADGKVGYDASTLSDSFKAQLQSLGAGESLTDSFTYAIRLGNGALSWATATVQIGGLNDAPVLSGVVTGNAVEDGSKVTLNALTNASDVDHGTTLTVVNVPVSLPAGVSYDAATHSFTLDPANAAYQHLAAGQTTTVTVNYGVSDGTATTAASASFTITGTNDVPVIGGVTTGGVTEEASTPNLTTSGALTIADVDAGESSFVAQAGTTGSNGYGTFTVDTAGNWTYSASNGQTAIQELGAGKTLTDSFTVSSLDGSNSQIVTVTINGTNDVPVIGGVSTGGVTEEASTPNLTAGGLLSITDVDAGESSFAMQAGTAGSNGYGTFNVDAAGNWSYSASNGQTAIQELGAGKTLTDSFTVSSLDGSNSQLVTVTITGTNDVPVIGGVSTGGVTEEAATPNLTTGGALTIADVDAGESSFVEQAGTPGSSGYGTFTVDTVGNWTYSASNGQTAIQELGAGKTLTDSFTVSSLDGTNSQTVTVTINGTNDVPVIGGVSTGGVTEEAATPNLTTGGALTIADVDAGESSFVAQAGTPGSSGYGTFTVDTVGNWTYSASNGQTAIQELGADKTLTDSFTVSSLDGTNSQTVTVTINGTNDVPVVTATGTSAYTENQAATAVAPSLTVSDVDSASLTGATVQITGNYHSGEDLLGFTNQSGITGSFNTTTGTLTLTGTASLAAYQTALQSVTYANTSDNPTTAARTVSFQVNDGTDLSAVSTHTVTVVAMNDAPVNSVPGTQTVNEDATLVFGGGNAINVADLDNNSLTVTLAATNGSLTLSGTSGLSFSAGDGVADATMTFTGTTASINAALNGMSYLGNSNYNGAAALQIQTSDGSLTDTDSVNVTVNPVNDAPTDISLAVPTSGSNLPGAGLLGTFSAADPDGAGTFTYSLQDGSSSGFSIAGNNLNVTSSGLGNNATYTLNVQVQDGAGGQYTETFNIITGSGSANTLPTGGSGDAILNGDDVLYGFNNSDVIYGGSGNDTLLGQDGADQLYGGDGNDILSGGKGADGMDGGAGTDRFSYAPADLGSGVDTITGFTTGAGGDTLAIGELLTGYTAGVSNLANFVQLTSSGGNTIVSIDANGSTGGASFTQLVTLQGVTGINLDTLLANGNIDPVHS